VFEGLKFYQLKKYPEAIVLFSKAIRLNPSYSAAYNNKGLIQINMNHYFFKSKLIE